MKYQNKMEENLLILRFNLLFLLLMLCHLNAIDVLIAKNKISYNAPILKKDLRLLSVEKIKKRCEPLSLKRLDSNKFIAKHFINKNTVICESSVKVYKKNSVIFNFGNIQIEQNGKIIFENDKYITIKKSNGKLKKIYKNGQNK